MKTPEVGDRVIIEFEVIDGPECSTSKNYVRLRWPSGLRTGLVRITSIKDVLPKPWEPKVGDRIKMKGTNALVIEYRGVFEGQVAYKFLVGGSVTHLSYSGLSKFEPAPS